MSRKALLIGVGNYENSPKTDQDFSELPSVKEDLDNLKRILSHHEMGAFEVQSLHDSKSEEILTTIEEFALGCQKEDLALIYFSGHGAKTNDLKLFLVACNTELVDRYGVKESTAVSAEKIYRYLTVKCKARSKILILDCCFSGAFDPRTKGGKDRVDLNIEKTFIKVPGVVVLTSSDSTGYSYANLPHRLMSNFTHYLVTGIETGSADKDRDGKISIQELYEYIQDQFQNEYVDQKPKIIVLKDEGYKIEIAKSPNTDEKPWSKDYPLTQSALQAIETKPSDTIVEFPDVIRWIDGKIMLLVKPQNQEWFYVDKYPVTASQYIAHLRLNKQIINWQSFWMKYGWSRAAEFPVTELFIEDAENYAQTFKKRLPTLTQWCLAASGGVEPVTIYPWGNQFQEKRCNSKEYWLNNPEASPKSPSRPEPTPIYQFPDQNSLGLCDIVGNVIEVAYCQKRREWFQIGGFHENDQSKIQIISDSTHLPLFHQPTRNIGFRCVAILEDYQRLCPDTG